MLKIFLMPKSTKKIKNKPMMEKKKNPLLNLSTRNQVMMIQKMKMA
jgi:hypothetical protein